VLARTTLRAMAQGMTPVGRCAAAALAWPPDGSSGTSAERVEAVALYFIPCAAFDIAAVASPQHAVRVSTAVTPHSGDGGGGGGADHRPHRDRSAVNRRGARRRRPLLRRHGHRHRCQHAHGRNDTPPPTLPLASFYRSPLGAKDLLVGSAANAWRPPRTGRRPPRRPAPSAAARAPPAPRACGGGRRARDGRQPLGACPRKILPPPHSCRRARGRRPWRRVP